MTSRAVVLLAGGVLFFACSRADTGHVMLRVDMAAEHDAGRFDPNAGDRLAVAGPFNNWQPDADQLSDYENDWYYGIPLSALTSPETDSLEFKFVILPGPGRTAPNGGWETLPNRRVAIADLARHQPVMIYNEPWGPEQETQVTFRVGMAGQQVLDFFDPDRGDHVVVTGSFTGWDPEGISLRADTGGVYSLQLPVTHRPDEPVRYKFRILPGQPDVLLPNGGWEQRPDRELNLSATNSGGAFDAGFAWFGDQMRIARFVVNAGEWLDSESFRPELGDLLQVELNMDGTVRRTPALVKTAGGQWETSVQIPLEAREISWKVVKNLEEGMTCEEAIRVTVAGAIIANRQKKPPPCSSGK